MYYKAKEMLQKARQPKHGGCKTNLERWHNDDQHRKSLSNNGWTEEKFIQHDDLALEDHSYIATTEERTRNREKLVLQLNKGVQGPMNQHPDFVEAKRELKRLHDETCDKDFKRKYPDSSHTTGQDNEETSNSTFEQHGGLIRRSHKET